MKKQRFIIKSLGTLGLIMIILIGIVFSKWDEPTASGDCGSCHGTLDNTIATNYTGNSVTISEGESFDLQIIVTGGFVSDRDLGLAFWHISTDGLLLPDTSPFIGEDNLYSEWNSDNYYAQFSWATPGSPPFIRTFRISTTSSSPASETLTIQCASRGDRRSNVIAFGITIIGPETNPPDVSITAPTDNSYVNGSSLSISATADDNGEAGVDTVWAEITNSTYNETISMSGTEPNYSGTWDSTNVFDGTYTLKMKANDTQGNLNNTESISIKVDNTAPGITIDSVLPNPSSGLATITASNSSSDIDGNGISATVSSPTEGDLFVGLAYQGSNQWTGTFTVSENGNYNININATDLAGNTATVGPTSITGDITNPSIIIDSPSASDIFGTTSPSYNVTISDASGLSTQWYTIDAGNTNNTFVGSTGLINQTQWNSAGQGSVNIIFFANDTVGNVNSAQVTITKDIIIPNAVINNPASDGEQVGGATISISGTANGTGSKIVSMYINDTRWGDGSQRPQTDPSGSTSGAYMFNNNTNIPLGFYWVLVNITDEAGNVNSTVRYFEVVLGDLTPPVLMIISFTPDPSNKFTNITVTSNEALISAPLLNITLPNTSLVYRIMFQISALTWRTNYTFESAGLHTIRVNGTDTASNVGYTSDTYEGDFTNPTVSITAPNLNDLYGAFAPSFDVITSDASGIDTQWYSIDGGMTNYTFVGSTGTVEQNAWNNQANGTVTIIFYANDTAGNFNFAQVIVRKDIDAPSILIVTPSSNDLTGVTAPGYDVTASDSSGLSTQWYTIDAGTTNFTFVGSVGSIDQTAWNGEGNGTVTIVFYVNDSMGNINSAQVTIRKDIINPIVSITTPLPDTIFGTNPPNYALSITEPNIDSIWFTLDGGATNSTPIISSGILTQSYWNTQPSGYVIIRFYANDSAGNVAFDEVNVTKDLVAPAITINSPSVGTSGTTAPSFNVTITDPRLNTTWYCIFDGIKWSEDKVFTGSTGTIDQTLWDSVIYGDLIIRFCGRDTLGNIGYADAGVTKENENACDGTCEENDIEPGILISKQQYENIAIIGILFSIAGCFILIRSIIDSKKIEKATSKPSKPQKQKKI